MVCICGYRFRTREKKIYSSHTYDRKWMDNVHVEFESYQGVDAVTVEKLR